MTIMMNDYVRAKADPRHIGVVRGFFSGDMVKVYWGESQWLEYIHKSKLEKIPEGTEHMLKERR